jgi:archaellum component FlaD/FlaE
MTTNPNDYDPNELRSAEEEPERPFLGALGDDGPGGGSGPPGAEEVLRSNQYRELFLLEQTSGEGGLTRPYLSSIPQSYAAEMIVFEWLEFLVDKTGFRRTMDVLRYYRSIEWITDEVEARLREYLTSFDDTGASADLDRSDHLLSLVYVARLAAMD